MNSKEKSKEDDNNIDYKRQLALNEDMMRKDVERHRTFFASMSKSRVRSGVAIIAGVLVISSTIFALDILNQDDLGGEQTSAVTCSKFQVEVETPDGLVCEECPLGEIGDLEYCESESPTGKCEVQESGCYQPKF